MKLMKDPQLDKTIEFVTMFDKFFDCLNVSSLDAGKLSRNKFKAPYRSSNDSRLEVSTTSMNSFCLLFSFVSVAEKRLNWIFRQMGKMCGE